MKRPSFQFYPADWQTDNSLRACSLAARGLWMEMICIMHQANPYGYFLLNQKSIQNSTLARMVGCSLEETELLLDELETNGVFVRDEYGTIYSKRMVKDEHIRQVRATAGKKGGNPNLKQGKKGQNPTVDGQDLLNQNPNQTGKQNPTPSSSSPSSINNLTPPDAHEESLSPLPGIPGNASEWVVFFQRLGYELFDIKTAENVTRFDDWCRRQVSLATAQIGVEAAEAKLGRKPDKPKYYLGFIEEAITAANRLNTQSHRQETNHGQHGTRRYSPNEAVRIARERRKQGGGHVIDGDAT